MNEQFSIEGKVAVITGAGGVLGGSIAKSFIQQGAKVAILDIRPEQLNARVEELRAMGGEAMGFVANVLDVEGLKKIADEIVEKMGTVDILINVAGGNMAGASIADDSSIFEMSIPDYEKVCALNLNGSVYPSLTIGKIMAEKGKGAIVNIASMASYQAITRQFGYSVAKTGIVCFTQWMAMEMAMKFGDGVRVNAIAPGFFIGDQNRALLINPDGSLTERSKKVLAKTPMNRFGDINELNGAVQFLCSDAASFITGTVLPIDGGFNCFSGV
ncbi:MAG: SDR family oxidoreductase [Tidjanibacter sp.]|nr:SDR family oxidoreductase [Tidjanibacter sp.]MBQ3070983.1 SDR family oxidoreductase [Tidjanibacter sp.]MBR1957637.1 SDR family oxidoreductase [Tidjanibacter sp.]MBR3931304.1 SDR family oxidoreductase [Tidjanibacter sp.]